MEFLHTYGPILSTCAGGAAVVSLMLRLELARARRRADSKPLSAGPVGLDVAGRSLRLGEPNGFAR